MRTHGDTVTFMTSQSAFILEFSLINKGKTWPNIICGIVSPIDIHRVILPWQKL